MPAHPNATHIERRVRELRAYKVSVRHVAATLGISEAYVRRITAQPPPPFAMKPLEEVAACLRERE